jgi:hypothetical protein
VITLVLSTTVLVLGLAIVVRTLLEGTGGGLGLLLGAALAAAGAARIYLQRQRG